MRAWNELSMAEKADVMKLAIEGGVYDLDSIRSGYNEYAKGGKIHIAPSKRGTFTAAASKHGKSVQSFASQVLAHPENYSPAMRKKANFARNARKWKHSEGGPLVDIAMNSYEMGGLKGGRREDITNLSTWDELAASSPLLYTIGKALDPTGITGWEDAKEAIGQYDNDPSIDSGYNAVMETTGATPIISKAGKVVKLIQGLVTGQGAFNDYNYAKEQRQKYGDELVVDYWDNTVKPRREAEKHAEQIKAKMSYGDVNHVPSFRLAPKGFKPGQVISDYDINNKVVKKYKKSFGGNLFEDGGLLGLANEGKTKHIYEGTEEKSQQMQVQKTPIIDLAMSNTWLYNQLYGKQKESNEHAIYLHYPNFYGGTGSTIRVGSFDVGAGLGKLAGIDKLPVGHAATILVDKDGNSSYYDYGRYKEGTDARGVHTFGAIKNGRGNWRKKTLPKQKAGENDSAYVARIQSELPYTDKGDFQVMSFPDVDVKKATDYANSEAYDYNRRNYGIGNVCADAASRLVLPFSKDEDKSWKIVLPLQEASNTQGYEAPAGWWSRLNLFSTGATAEKMRKVAKKTYIMKSKK